MDGISPPSFGMTYWSFPPMNIWFEVMTPVKVTKIHCHEKRPILQNSTKLVTSSRESSGSTLTLPRATSSARSAKKVFRRLMDVKAESGSSASDVLPQRIRTSSGWVVAAGRKAKKSVTATKKQKSSGKSSKKTLFPKVDSGCNTSLVSLASAPGQVNTLHLPQRIFLLLLKLYESLLLHDCNLTAVRIPSLCSLYESKWLKMVERDVILQYSHMRIIRFLSILT